MGKAERKRRAAERRKTQNIKKNIVGEVKKLEKIQTPSAEEVLKSMTRVGQKVSRLKPPSRQAVIKSAAFNQLKAWIRGYMLLSNDTPPLPSMFRERVQVHNLEFDFPIPAEYRTTQGFYAFMTQPSFEKFLRIAVPGTAQGTGKDDQEEDSTTASVDTGRTPQGILLCSDKSWTLTQGANVTSELAPVLANRTTFPPASAHWSANKNAWIDGLKIYPVGSIIAGDEPVIHFKNRADKTVDVQSVFIIYDQGQVILHEIASVPLAVGADAGADIPFTAGQWAANIATQYNSAAYFSYGVRLFEHNSGDQLPYMGPNVHITIKFGAQHFVFGAPLGWRDYGVLDVVCKDEESRIALAAQYRLASHIKFGLYETTVQNASVNMVKGGLIASVQFPGGTRASSVLKNPDTLFPSLATMPIRSSGSMLFDLGQHYFFVPEKIQDWLFKQITDDEVQKNFLLHDAPKIVSAVYAPPAIGFTDAVINLKGWIHYELLTEDRSSVQFKAGGSTLNQLEVLMGAFSTIDQFTENPKHIEKIWNGIKSVVTSPTFRKIAMDLTMMGAEMLLI